MIGGSKNGEYNTTIDTLSEKIGKSKEEVMYILYFLHDSQYCNNDLKNMADLILEQLKNKKEKVEL